MSTAEAEALGRTVTQGDVASEALRFTHAQGVGVVGFLGAWIVAVSVLAQHVPIAVHPLRPDVVPRMRLLSVACLIVVLVSDAIIVTLVLRSSAVTELTDRTGGLLPHSLRPHTIRSRGLVTTALASFGLFIVSGLLGLPLWGMALLGLTPWLPLYVSEVSWQYRHYGFYAFFGALTVLQLGHLNEHLAQNIQLLLSHGNLAVSHGIFGQLDVETVHFIWQCVVWLGTGLLLYKLGKRNVWLWIAFVTTSAHTIEHLYLYWLYAVDYRTYLAGGWNGIVAQGGLFDLPLARPYLHLLYNLFSVVPFVLAFWQQSEIVYDRARGEASARLTAAQLVRLLR